MGKLLEEMIRAIELWLKLAKKNQPYVNPDLDPVLLVPGIAGSILNAVTEDGQEDRVWVRLLRADYEFCTKLWSRFDKSSGKTLSLDPKTRIEVPQDRYGLSAIDCLDPDMIIGRECVYYFHDMIEQMIKWGFEEGKTLFGFGYDFRQSNRLQETMDRFSAKLKSVYASSGGKKINIITHSMGGLLVKCFMSLHSDIFEKYVNSWIAIAAPFQGAPGYITPSLLNGLSFVDGWEQNFFISKWSMHQLLVECPSIYELIGCTQYEWKIKPLLQMWREKKNCSGYPTTILESYRPADTISILEEALANNKVVYDGVEMPLPFNIEILKLAIQTQEVLNTAKVPPGVKFYNIYGINNDTAHSVCYGSEQTPITDLQQLLLFKPKYIYVDGDGTVSAESAKADGLEATERVGVPGDHRSILCEKHVFRILKHWLNAENDPFYNPVNDYVILPTAFDYEKFREHDLQITTASEDWEIVTKESNEQSKSSGLTPMVGTISMSNMGSDQLQEEAIASLIVHPQSEGKQHVKAVGVSVAIGC